MNSRVRIKDVAQAADVSVSTVSQVLNGKAGELRIGKETQARVLAIARQMGYVPNRLARDMVLGRRSFIGLVLSVSGLVESAMLLPELEPLFASAGYRLILATVPTDPNAASAQIAGLLRDGVAGLLCSAAAMPVAIQMAAGTCPVLGLSPAAGRTMLALLRGESVTESVVDKLPPVSPASSSPVVAETPKTVPPPSPSVTHTAMVSPAPVLEPAPEIAEPATPAPAPEPSSVVTPPSVLEPIPETPAPASDFTSEPLPDVAGIPESLPEPAPVLTPSSGVVAAVPSGTEPELVPTVTPTPETAPIITEPVQAESAYTPPPILEPAPEPVAPVLEPKTEIAVPVIPAPAPEPTPVVITPVETEPVFVEPTPVVEPDPVFTPATPEPEAVTPEPVAPVLEPEPEIAEPVTPVPVPEPVPVVIITPKPIPPPPEPTPVFIEPTPEPRPVVVQPVIPEPVIVPEATTTEPELTATSVPEDSVIESNPPSDETVDGPIRASP